MNGEQMRQVGELVVSAREAKGWNQVALAAEVGLTDNTIRKIERGEKVAPGTLRKVLDALGIEPVADTMRRQGYPADVELILDLIGLYLVAYSQEERTPIIHDLTRFLAQRAKGQPATGR